MTVRRTRASLARFVVELAATAPGDALKTLLARALDDDTLELVYPVGDGRFADRAGIVFDVPSTAMAGPRRRSSATARPRRRSCSIARSSRRPPSVDEVAAAARLTLDNERLQAELRVQEADLRASRARVIAAGDGERRRLERDLHDGAQQRLVGSADRLAPGQVGVATERRSAPSSLDAAISELQAPSTRCATSPTASTRPCSTDEGLASGAGGARRAVAVPGRVLAGIPTNGSPQPVEHAAYRDRRRRGEHGPSRLVAIAARAARRRGRRVAPPRPIVDLHDRVGALDGRLDVERPNVAPPPRGDPVQVVPCG